MKSNRWRSPSQQPCTADEVQCKNAICWISKYVLRLAGRAKQKHRMGAIYKVCNSASLLIQPITHRLSPRTLGTFLVIQFLLTSKRMRKKTIQRLAPGKTRFGKNQVKLLLKITLFAQTAQICLLCSVCSKWLNLPEIAQFAQNSSICSKQLNLLKIAQSAGGEKQKNPLKKRKAKKP